MSAKTVLSLGFENFLINKSRQHAKDVLMTSENDAFIFDSIDSNVKNKSLEFSRSYLKEIVRFSRKTNSHSCQLGKFSRNEKFILLKFQMLVRNCEYSL